MKKKIAIVVGHSEKDPGAFAKPPIAQYEYFFNRELALSISTILGSAFSTNIFLRNHHSIEETYGIVSQFDPHMSIELHFNSSENPDARGTEVLCVERYQDFALALNDEMCLALKRKGPQVRGAKLVDKEDRGYGTVSSGIGWYNALLEPFFGSSTLDCILVHDYQEDLALSIAQCLRRWASFL